MSIDTVVVSYHTLRVWYATFQQNLRHLYQKLALKTCISWKASSDQLHASGNFYDVCSHRHSSHYQPSIFRPPSALSVPQIPELLDMIIDYLHSGHSGLRLVLRYPGRGCLPAIPIVFIHSSWVHKILKFSLDSWTRHSQPSLLMFGF